MFGSGTVSSTWGQPQQNQQQQQQQQPPSAFGQPSTFGSGSAFGSGTGAFGQPQQQQQQQPANPMFGGLGGTSNAGTTGTGFGAFGSNNQQSGGVFGQPKPATGFGAFGGGGGGTFGSTGNTSTFGSTPGTGAFGSTPNPSNTSGGIFGQPSTSTNTFGSGGGIFGQNKPATPFGATNTTEGGAVVTTGSANPPFNPYTEKDNVNANVTLQYQSISAMPAYRTISFEELRVQDYAQNRKTSGGFGQSAFGGASQPTTGIFGQNSSQPAATGTTFGGFGNTSTTNQPSTGFGAFGQQPQPPNTTAGTSSTGIFGAGGGGAFGQNTTQPQQTTGFGAFGQPQNAQTNTGTSGLFGGGGAFGSTNNQPKPAFGGTTFGGTTGGAFGQTNTGGGLFGQQPQQQQQPQQGTTTGAFGAFGQNQNQPKPGIFGSTTTTQPSTGFGTFGQANQQQPTQPSGGLFGNSNPGGGLFGQNTQQQQQQPQQGGLFGATNTQTQPSGGLFGNTNTGGGLFGANNNQQQPGAQPPQQNAFGSGGLFGGAKPATTQPTGGLFGVGSAFGTTTTQPTQPTGGLFGSTLGQPQQQQTTNTFGNGGLFGAKPTMPTLGTSMSTGQQQGGLGTSMFGNTLGGSTATMGASTMGQSQAPLTASIAQPISTNLPIFSMLPPGPRAVTLDQQPKKKPGYFVDVPTRAPVPQLQLRYAPASTKLRGFGSTSTPPGVGSSQMNSSLLYASGKPNALSLSKASSKSHLGPDSFLTNGGSSPTLGSGARQSVKKLTLDKKIEAADLFSNPSGGPSFNPKLSIAARETEASAAGRASQSPTPAARAKGSHNRFVGQTSSEVFPSSAPESPEAAAKDPGDLQEGDYFVKPSLATLKALSHEELSAFSGLVVGRVGYGTITFQEPVDLTGLPRLSSLLGEVVRFDDKECSVYPDADEAEKPPPGAGLNVAARIELVRCWALDKATREAVKDPNDPAAVRHLKRLQKMKHTKFESFDIEQGKWTFTVDHF